MDNTEIITCIIILCLLIILGYYYQKGKYKLIENYSVGDMMNVTYGGTTGISTGSIENIAFGQIYDVINTDGTSAIVNLRNAAHGPFKVGFSAFGEGSVDFSKIASRAQANNAAMGLSSAAGATYTIGKALLGYAISKKKRELANQNFEQCRKQKIETCRKKKHGTALGRVRLNLFGNTLVDAGGKCKAACKAGKKDQYINQDARYRHLMGEECSTDWNETLKRYSEKYPDDPNLIMNASEVKCVDRHGNPHKNCEGVSRYRSGSLYSHDCLPKLIREKAKMKKGYWDPGKLDVFRSSISKIKYHACQWMSDHLDASPNNLSKLMPAQEKSLWKEYKCNTKRLNENKVTCQEISDIYLGQHEKFAPELINRKWKEMKCKSVPPPMPPRNRLHQFPGCDWIVNSRGPSKPGKTRTNSNVYEAPKNTFGIVNKWWELGCMNNNVAPKPITDNDKKKLYQMNKVMELPWYLKSYKYELIDKATKYYDKLNKSEQSIIDEYTDCQYIKDKYKDYGEPKLPKQIKKIWDSRKCLDEKNIDKENIAPSKDPFKGKKIGDVTSEKIEEVYGNDYTTMPYEFGLEYLKKTTNEKITNNLQSIKNELKLLSSNNCQQLSDTYGIIHQISDGIAPPNKQKEYRDNKCRTKPKDICKSLKDHYGMYMKNTGYGKHNTHLQKLWDQNKCMDTIQSLDHEKRCQFLSNRYGVNAGVTWGTIYPHGPWNYWVKKRWWAPNGKADKDCGTKPWWVYNTEAEQKATGKPTGDMCHYLSDNFGVNNGITWGTMFPHGPWNYWVAKGYAWAPNAKADKNCKTKPSQKPIGHTP
jgi:hypothetical protein